MAVDTRAERQAAMNFGGTPLVLPNPDGTVGDADRAHLLELFLSGGTPAPSYLGPALENIAYGQGRNWHVKL